MGIESIRLGPKSPLAEGRFHKGGLNGPTQISERPPDPPPMRPERANREGDQPLPVEGEASVFAAVHTFLREREATGIRRYGRSLETFNDRNACRDLREELLDGLVYATQVEMEHKAVVEALIVLARYVRDGVASDGVLAATRLAEKLEASR